MTINNYKYSFKKELSYDKFSYRCINRNNSKSLLTISKDDILSILQKKEINIQPKLTQNHTCEGSLTITANSKEVTTKNDNIKIVTDLIKLNPEKTLGWHITKKKTFKKESNKKILYKLRKKSILRKKNFYLIYPVLE